MQIIRFLFILAITIVGNGMSFSLMARSTSYNLTGKTICVFGDSYVKNHHCDVAETWHAKAADILGMEYINMGINGNSILYDRTDEGYGAAMTDRYRELPDSIDCLLIIAGHNDAGLIKGHTDLSRFKNALVFLIQKLKDRYPHAKMGYVTPWHVDRQNFNEVITTIQNVCSDMGIPVFDAETSGGIKVNDTMFREKYFQNRGKNDTAHLNDDGHNLIVDEGVRFIQSLFR